MANERKMAVGQMLLGGALRARRLELGWGLSDMVERTGMSMSFISEVERGRKTLSLESLVTFAGALELTVVQLLTGVYPFDDVREPKVVQPPLDGRVARWQRDGA